MSFIDRRRICFYSSMFDGRSSAWEIASLAVKKGVGGIELMNFCDELSFPDMSEALKLGKYARENNLALPCFSVGINLFPKEDRRARIDRVKAYAEICSALEIPYLHHTTVTYLDPERITASFSEMMDFAVGVSLELNEYAKALGVITLVEDQGFIVNGIKNYGEFFERTGGKIGVVLDVGNIMFVNEYPDSFCRAFLKEIKHVHLKDYRFADSFEGYKTKKGRYIADVEIGTGEMTLRETVEMLEASGYGGHYSIEFAGVKNDAEVDRVLERIEKGFSCEF